jgi:hypothetical protein
MFGALAGAVSIGIFDFCAVFGGAFVSALGSLVGAAVGIVYKSSSAVVGAVGGGTATGLVSAIIGAVIGIVIGAVVGVVTYGPFSLLYDLWGRWGLGIFWGIWWFMTFSLCQHAKRCERAAANPLQGLLDEFNPTPVAPRRQGWASFLPLGLFSRRSRNLFGSR